MTLITRVSTPVGLVFCADSLISYPESVEEIDRAKSGRWFAPGELANNSPSMLESPRFIDREFIVNTVSNVSKIHRLSNLPVAYSVAGSGNFLLSSVDNGRYHWRSVPFESFSKVVDRIITELITRNPELPIPDICRSACYSLSCGLNGVKDVNTSGWSLSVLGGGFGPSSSLPHVFDFDLIHRGQNEEVRVSIIDASFLAFFNACGICLPHFCKDADIFSEFCEVELERCILAGILKSCIWSSFFNIPKQSFLDDVVKDVLPQIRKGALLVSRILDVWGTEGLNSYDFSDVIRESWELREVGYENKYSRLVDGVIDGFLENNNEAMAQMVEYYHDGLKTSEICGEIQAELFSEFPLNSPLTPEEEARKDLRTSRFELLYERLDEKTRSHLSYEAFFGMCAFFGVDYKEGYAASVATGDFMFNEEWGDRHYSYWAPKWAYFGISHRGQDDVVERIMGGMDFPTKRKNEKGVRDYTMDAAQRLGTIIEAGLDGREAPTWDKSDGSGQSLLSSQPEYSPGISNDEGEDDLAESTLEDFTFEPHLGFVPGAWNGFYITSTDSESGEVRKIRNKFSIEFNFDIEGNISGTGQSSEGEISATVEINDSGDTSLDVTMTRGSSYHDARKISVDGNLETWGFNGGFEEGEEWRNFIMWPVDSVQSEINSISVIQSAIRTLQTELENYSIESDKWDINWEYMPLETSIELVHYLMESTMKKQHFNREVPTVGGKIKTVVITHKGEYMEI